MRDSIEELNKMLAGSDIGCKSRKTIDNISITVIRVFILFRFNLNIFLLLLHKAQLLNNKTDFLFSIKKKKV